MSSALFILLWARKLQPPRQAPPSASSSSRRMGTAEEQRELSAAATSIGVYLRQAGGVAAATGRFKVHWRALTRSSENIKAAAASSLLSCLWRSDPSRVPGRRVIAMFSGTFLPLFEPTDATASQDELPLTVGAVSKRTNGSNYFFREMCAGSGLFKVPRNANPKGSKRPRSHGSYKGMRGS